MVIYCGSEFDLDRQDPPAFDDEQVNFRPSLRPPEKKLGTDQALSGKRSEFFDHHSLEGRAPPCPGRKVLRLSEAGQKMQKAAISHVKFCALGEAFLHVGEVRLKTADHERSFQYVQIAGYRVRGYGEGAREVRDVQEITMDVRQHGPECA